MFTHRIGSEGAPSRRTVFIRGTNTKQWEVPKMIIIIIIIIIIKSMVQILSMAITQWLQNNFLLEDVRKFIAMLMKPGL
jgi:hypothetical protein